MPEKIYFAVVLITLVGQLSAETVGDPPAHISEPFQLIPYEPNQSLVKNLGDAFGIRNCGGAGRFLYLRYEYCTPGVLPPCIIPTNANARGEIAFVPSKSDVGLRLRLKFITAEGQVLTYDKVFPDANVEAGKEYAFTVVSGPSSVLKGKLYTVVTEIFRVSDNQVEVCYENDYFAV